MDILLGAFVGLKYARFNNFVGIVNFMVALITVSIYALVVIFLSYKIYFWNREGDKIEEMHRNTKFKEWEFLLKEIKTDVRLSTYIVVLSVIKDFLFSPFIIFGIENANIQILPILLISIIVIIFVAKTLPFKSKLENITLILNSACYLAILFLFFICHNMSDNMTQKQRYKKFGTPCVFFICIVLLINLVIGVITLVEMIKEACKKRKEKK